jgi:hypothetical protein
MLLDWLHTIRNPSRSVRRPRRAARTGACRIQALESRLLLTTAPVGAEFGVNTQITGTQSDAAVATDASGNFVVAWQSDGQDGSASGIFAQRFDANGNKVGAEVQVNSFTVGSQSNVDVAMDADGDFVVVWQSSGQDGSGDGIYAQRFTGAGVAAGAEFRVNTATGGNQAEADVAMDALGNFVVVWESTGQDGSGDGIYAQRYTNAGAAVGTEFRVNTITNGDQQSATVGVDADGDFVVAWDNQGIDIRAQRYTSAGVATGSEIVVNSLVQSGVQTPSIAVDATGDFVVAWSNSNVASDVQAGVFARSFNSLGTALTSDLHINTTVVNDQTKPAVAVDATGNFVVVWEDSALIGNGQDGSLSGIFAQRYNSSGAEIGSEFRVNSYTTGAQNSPAVAMTAAGDFVVAWDGQSFSGTAEVAARVFTDLPGPQVVPETFAISENRPIGYAVGTVDVISDNAVTFAITSGNTGNAFAIDSMTGVLTVNSVPPINFELNPTFNLTVTATEVGNPLAFDSETITVNLNDLNEAPFLGSRSFAVSENRPVGYVVGTVTAFDQDAGQTLSYSIVGGDPQGIFAINAATGQLTVARAILNYETTPVINLQVRATDNGSPQQGTTATIVINVRDLNEAPSFTGATTLAVSENRPVGYVVGNVTTFDPEGNTVTYSIVGGDPNSQFAINATTGQITVAKATIDFETNPQFQLQVRAQDDGSPANARTQVITVNVNDLNEAPTWLAPTTFSVQENSIVGTQVGTLATVDPEGDTVTYTILSGNTNNAFVLNASTGVLRVANRAALDFETQSQFLLSVQATDDGSPSNSRTQVITVNVTDVVDESSASVVASSKDDEAASSAGSSGGTNGQQVAAANASAQLPAAEAAVFDLSEDDFLFWLANAPAAAVAENTEAAA